MITAMLLTWSILAQAPGGCADPSAPPSPFARPPAWLREPAPGLSLVPSLLAAPQQARSTYPGSRLDLVEAAARAHTVVTGRATDYGIPTSQGSVLMAPADIRFGETWKGPPPAPRGRFGLAAIGGEVLPEVDAEFVFFIATRRDVNVVIKAHPLTPATKPAIRRLVEADDKRLPHARVPLADARARAHTIVVAEETGAFVAGAGAAIGSCGLRVSAALKGDAGAVDGRAIGFMTLDEVQPPTAGRSYVYFVGNDHGADTILKVLPATPANIAAAR